MLAMRFDLIATFGDTCSRRLDRRPLKIALHFAEEVSRAAAGPMVAEVCRKSGREVFIWFSRRLERLVEADEGGFTLMELMAVITFPFHKQLP